MNSVMIENERQRPDLKGLRLVVESEKETEARRLHAAYIYTLIALALNRDRKEVKL